MDRRSAYVVPAPLNTSSDRRQASSPAESFASFPNAAKEPPMTALVYAVPDTAETIDRDPLEALARGDEAAWRSTVRRFEGMVRSTARSVLRNDADVDEAVQRTWIQLLRSAARIKDPRCLPGWLATTARREALSVLRSQQRAIPARTSPTASPPTTATSAPH
jgi:hypothetical protein